MIKVGMLRAYIRDGLNAGAIMGAGDIVAQVMVDRRKIHDWDYMRTLRFSAVGLVYVGPVLRRWYGFLESKISKNSKPINRGLKKMLIDQLCFAPVFTLSLIFIIPYVNGEKVTEIKDRTKKQYFSIMARNYCIWPAAQIINFTVVPMKYQVLYAQFIALIWNCYLSHEMNKKK